MLNRNILLYGQEQLPSRPITLRAGPLTMIFEPDNAFLRYVRLGDREVVRNIYAVVRDQNWNTIPWQVTNLQIDARPEAFDLTFDVECREREIHYVWRGAIMGEASGKISFTFDGESKLNFLRNRIGICVLHPVLECAGNEVTLEHSDGAIETTSFPKDIAPWQPLKDVRAITHDVSTGGRVEIRFDGEVFETEDQRNFGDASFKTYSTPQDLPKPVMVKPGDRVHHRVAVSLLNPDRKAIPPAVLQRKAQLSISTNVRAKPALGVCLSRHSQPLTEREIERIRSLRLAHVRSDITFAGNWREELRADTAQAGALQLPLQCALHFGPRADAELAEFVRELEAVRPQVSLWIIYQRGHYMVPTELVQFARQKLAIYGAQILVAAGISPFFTEFNRNRPPADLAALPCYPDTPQIHLTDPLTLIENVANVSETVESARKILPQPAVISPVTLKPWANRGRGADDISSGHLPGDVDARQMSLFGAAWTLAHIARLASSEPVHSATYFETTGWRGLMETEAGSPLGAKFPSIAGAAFPVYHVFAALAGFDRVCPMISTHPLQVEGLTLLDAQDRKWILVANLLPEEQEMTIQTGTCEARMHRLNAQTAEAAMCAPEQFLAELGEPVKSVAEKIELKLAPYELARISISSAG